MLQTDSEQNKHVIQVIEAWRNSLPLPPKSDKGGHD